MKKNIQPRLDDNYTSQSWARGDKLYASDLTKMSRQVDSNENELVELTTNVVPKIVAEIADHQSTLDQFAPKIAKIDVPEGSTIVGEIDKAVADLVNGAPETLDTIKEVADAIEENGDAITALNTIVTTNKGAIEAVQAAHQTTADKLDKLDQVAVKYSEFTHGDDPAVRHTIQLKNYDNITGVTTTGLGANLAMVSKWDVADFGSAIIPANINAKDGKVTINDSHQIATVDQIPDVSKFETIENVKSSLQALEQKIQANTETSSQQLNAVKEQINSKIDQTKTELVDQIDAKQDAGDYPEYQQFRAGVNQDRVRKTIQLANADTISGVDTSGTGRNIAMISEWNKVDLGTNALTMNLNSKDGIVQINDTETVATTKNIRDAYNHLGSEVVKQLNDHKTQSDNTYVPFVTVGKAGKVKVTTDDSGNMIISSIEDSKVGAQASININSQNAMMMTSYKTGRQEAGLVHASPIGVWLKRRTPEGEDISVEVKQLADNIAKTAELQKTSSGHTASIDTINTELGTKLSTDRFDQYTQDTDTKIKRLQDHQAQTDNNVYTKDEIDNKLAGAFHYKGTVQTFAELPKDHNEKGDVWNVVEADVDHHIKAGDNVAWNGESWDALSGIVDLSAYDNIEATSEKISAAVAPKADKTYVDAQLGTKANAAALTSHEQAFESYKTQAQASIDAKADQQYVINQLASKVNQEAYDADKLENKTQLDTKVDKKQHQTDLNVININVGKKVETKVFEAAKAELEAAIAGKQDAGDYVTNATFDQHVEQYQADKPTFAVKANIEQALALKADKEEIKHQLAGKAESVHTHAISEVTGLNDALNAKVDVDTYTSDKATFAIKTEVSDALAGKVDNTALTEKLTLKADKDVFEQYKTTTDKAINGIKEAKVEKNVYDAHVETTKTELNKKLDKATHESYVDTVNVELGKKLDSGVYTVDKATFALKTELEPLATKAEVEQKLAGAVASVYRYKGSVATTDELPKQDQVTGDVYNVESDGANVAWDGEKWDKLGGPIDLSTYATIEAVDGKIAQAKTELQAKIDHNGEEIARVEGKVDSHNAVFTKYQQTVDGKFAQEVKDRDAAIKVEKTAREQAVTEVANNLSTHEQAFEAFKVTNTAEFAKVRGEFAAADTQLEEKLTAKIDTKVAAADFEAFKTGQYKTDVDALKQADADEAQARQTLDTKFETFKTETYEPKVAELAKSIGDETTARQAAITETTHAFKAADEKVTSAYTKAIETAKNEVTTKVTEVEGALNAYKGYNDVAVAKVKTDVTEAFGAADKALETKVTQGYTAAVEGEKTAREGAIALLATKVELEGINTTLTGKFGEYYTKSEVDGKVSSVYRYKGSVANEQALPKDSQVTGDVYNVDDTGMNVAWDGKKWDKLGSVVNLTPYATTEAVEAKITEAKQAATEALNQHAQTAETTYAKKAEVTKQIETVDGKFAGKADKVHTHTIENVTGLQDALDGKQAAGDYALKSEVKTVDDKFAGYTTTEALNVLLDDKAAVVHTHTVDNVTGLQAALDAKMAASEAAKFATHDHNHDQTYLAIKGKAESAKVADSVAWANVTGTEAIAVKSEVEAVDAKFASYTTTEALAAEYASKQALTDGLKAKAEAAHTHVAADITDLQDKLDAKLDVGGKAESAKVADSVAWTGVTGTEGVALKSEVTALESKKANTDWANKTFATKVELGGYQAKGEYALKSDLDSKMEASEASKFAQASHVHTIENVTGLQQALNDKIAVADADGKYALKSAIDGLATKEELNGKAAASHTHQEGEVEGLTAKLATFALKSEIAGFVTDEALKRDYTNTADLGQLLDSKLDTTAGDKKYATKDELSGYQPKGEYIARSELSKYATTESVNQGLADKISVAKAADFALKSQITNLASKSELPVLVKIPMQPQAKYTEQAIAQMFGCQSIEQVGTVITGDRLVYIHTVPNDGADYKIPVQYCGFKVGGSTQIVMIAIGLDTTNNDACKYTITIELNADNSTIKVDKAVFGGAGA